MKSSPRPPRRFSRWQTTKRTFVLGAIGPKPAQNSINEEPKGSSIAPVAEKDGGRIVPLEGASDSFESDCTQNSQKSSKPKHVRRLKLNSSHLVEDAEKFGGLSKPDEENLRAAESQSQIPLSANEVNVPHESSHRSISTSGSSPKPPVSAFKPTPQADKEAREKSRETNGKSSANSVAKTLSNSDNHVTLSDISHDSGKDGDTQVQTKSSLRQRVVPSTAMKNTRKQKENNESVINSSKSESALASPATDKTEGVQVKPSLRNSKSLRDSVSRREVLGISKGSSINSHYAACGDDSVKARTRLRDRSKMKSPADLMKIRQYPEKYLNAESAKKSNNVSVERSNVKKRNGSATPNRHAEEVSVNKTSSASLIQTGGHPIAQASRKNGPQRPKSKASPRSVHNSDKPLNKTSGQAKPDQKSPETSLKRSTAEAQLRLEKRHSVGKKSKQVETDQSRQPDLVNSQHAPSLVLQNESHFEKGIHSKESQNAQSRLSGDSSEICSHSSKENPGGRSLRNRNQLATPESLQEKRQYPISFYPSKTRANILNASVSAKSRSLNRANQPQSTHHSKPNLDKDAHLNKIKTSSKQRNEKHGTRSKDMLLKNKSQGEELELNDLSRKHHVMTVVENSRKPSSRMRAVKKNPPGQPISLPRQVQKGFRLQDQRGDRQVEFEDNHWLSHEGQGDLWEIVPASKNSLKTARPQQRAPAAKTKTRTGSTINETVLGLGNNVPRKRKLVDQFYQDEAEEEAGERKQDGKSRKVLLWCEQGQTRSAADVNVYDVIFQTALDEEKKLSDSAEDGGSKKLVKKVFSGFKSNIKSMIAQELKRNMLEKEMREKKKRCRKLWKDVGEKQAEALRLKQKITSLETDKDSGQQKISSWMMGFSRLSQMVLSDKDT